MSLTASAVWVSGVTTSHAAQASLPPASLGASVSEAGTVELNSSVRVTGQVQAPAGGLLTQVGGLVISLVQAVLQPLTGVARAPITLELKTPTGWSAFSSTTASGAGSYSLAVPTYAYGTRTWRVATGATATSSATTSAPFTVAVRTGQRARGSASSYRLLSHGRARWNPCTPVPYYVNTAGMPRGAMNIVRASLAQIRAATGLTFRYAGRSRGVPFAAGATTKGMPTKGFTIAWSTPGKVRGLRGSTVALSGAWSRLASLTGSSKAREYVAGGIVIDRTERLRTNGARGRTLKFVLLHELGHLVGLDHVGDRSQVMSTRVGSGSLATFGAGDLAGLNAVGLGRGCL